MQTVRVKINTAMPVVKPVRRNARGYQMGTVMMRRVRIVPLDGSFYAVGELLSEHTDPYPPNHPALRKRLTCASIEGGRVLTIGRPNDRIDVTDGEFDVAYFHGSTFYVSEF